MLAPREYFVNAASSLPNATDVRVCKDKSSARALPSTGTIPRTNYPGVAVGGFAELISQEFFGAPFVIDAYNAALIERAGPTPCSLLPMQNVVNIPAPDPRVPVPRVIALVGGGSDPLQTLTFGVQYSLVRAIQMGIASPSLAKTWDLTNVQASFGPLDAACSSGLYQGPINLGESVPSVPVTLDTSTDFERTGFKLCARKKGGTNVEVVLQQSLLDMQTRSAPDVLPSDFYGDAQVFFLVVVGDENAGDPAHGLHALMIPFPVTH
jgi:hypothetical protein